METRKAAILAAGEGTRMHSSRPKVMHLLCGRPLLWHVLRAVEAVDSAPVVVVGRGSEEVQSYFGDRCKYVVQEQRLGTGHALQQTLSHLPPQGELLVLCGDTPLLTGETLHQLVVFHREKRAAATVVTACLDDPTGYGRILRDDQGRVAGIVEELHTTEVQKTIQEINTGSYCFNLRELHQFLPSLPQNPTKGEYYLTDLLPLLLEQGHGIAGFVLEEVQQALGINDRVQLARAAGLLRQRINEELMRSGVTLVDPATTYVDVDVQVGPDTVIYPQSILEGQSRVGEGCLLGPGIHVMDSQIGDGVTCRQSVLLESRIGNRAQIGPFAYLRPGSVIEEEAKIGDFVEVKNSTIGRGSKVPHLSYVGDATLEPGVNMGAGSIVVNYDGKKKHRTHIGQGSFIGCNSNLVAPLEIGPGAFIAAGSTITRNVPPGTLALSRSNQEHKEGLARRFLGKKEK